MEIGSNVIQIANGKAYEGVISQHRKRDGVTEFRVAWHNGYASWERAVDLDMADDA